MRIKGKREQVIQVRAKCSICGKTTTIRIRKDSRKILSNWQYFGKIDIPNSAKKVDYWECNKCAAKIQSK